MNARWVRWLGNLLGGFVLLLIVVVGVVYAISEHRAHKRYAITPRSIVIATDSATVARGAHIASAIGKCVECHGETLEGQVLFDDGALGRVAAPNLTRGTGGVGRILTDADYVRAIRHGVGPDGRALLIMPSEDFMELTDADLAAVISYVKSVRPVDNELPTSEIGPLGRALLVAGKLPIIPAERIDHTRGSVTPVPIGVTPEYGRYLARVGCVGCHGATLTGGPVVGGDPSWPPAADLTRSGPTKSWTLAEFTRLLRAGLRPDGSMVNGAMPWRTAGRMTDEEIGAVWLYLRTLSGQPSNEQRQTASR